MRYVTRLPGFDIRFPGYSTEQVKFHLEKLGLSFRGIPDSDGFQDVYLPAGWSFLEKIGPSRPHFVLDENGRIRLEVISEETPRGVRYCLELKKL
jgi:peroxiredoxin